MLRVLPWLLLCSAIAQAPKPVGTMSQLMLDVILPASNAIFYVREGPQDPKGWTELQYNALVLGEIANLLMSPERARDKEQWMKDAQLLLEVGQSAYQAAKSKDVKALQDLNDPLYEACQSCHEHYRPGYRRR